MRKGVESISNWILYLALVFLVIAVLISSVLHSKENESLAESSFTSLKVSLSLEGTGIISEALKKEVENVVRDTNHISKVQIYNVKDIMDIPTGDFFNHINNRKPNYEYGREIFISKALFVDLYPLGSGSGEWYVVTERRSFHTVSMLCLFLGGLLYFILFSIWAMKNAYRQKRLNVMWGLVFVLFNVPGYLIFLLVDKNRTNSNHGIG